MKERPCKVCGHIFRHDIENNKAWGLTCREAQCKCQWYESMSNLEYLEWLDKQNESKANIWIDQI